MTNQEILGDIGEIWYTAKYGGELSEDKYDSEKDVILNDGTYAQIKVQSRHPNQSFTINTKQTSALENALKVDKLVFIEYSASDTIIVYECKDRKYFKVTTKDGRIMACFPIENMSIIEKVKNKKLANLMRNFSKSQTLKHHE